MTLDLRSALGGLALVAGLGFMGTAPFVADYVVIACGLIGLGLALHARSKVLTAPAAIMIYAALALLAVSVPFVYRGPLDLLPLLACLPLLAAPGIAALLERSGDRPVFWLGAHALPLLCLFGVASAVGMGLWEAYATGINRAGVGNNPIHFGGITTILGFLALTGLVSNTARWRFIYLAGPALALVGVVLSGSRGPLVAWCALALVSLPVLLLGLRNWRLALATLLAAVGGVVLFLVLAGDSLVVTRLLRMSGKMSSALSQDGPGEVLLALLRAQDANRTALLDAGWQALQSSPIFGIGYGQLMPLVRELFPDRTSLHTLENLHSDFADFAALGGIMGIAAYFLLLLSPAAVLRSLRLRDYPALWLAAIVLIVGYATLGLTNAMFGVLPQTALFAVALAHLMAQGQRARLTRAEQSEPRR
mgnify:CR=1 FL=1